MTRKDQLPLHTALSLMARERISGEASPAATRILEMWRDSLDEKAAAAMEEMVSSTEDQESFARAARKLLTALDLAEAEMESEADQDEEGDEGGDQSSSRTRPAPAARARSRNPCRAPSPKAWRARPPTKRRRTARKRAPPPRATKPGGPQARKEIPQTDDATRYRAFSTQFDEVVEADDLATRMNSPGCASSSTSSCSICRASSPSSPTGSSAA